MFISLENGLFLEEGETLSRMDSICNAMTKVVSKYKGLTYEIAETTDSHQHILTVYNECVPGSYLKLEVHDVGRVPVVLVLQKINVGRRSMVRFLDRLLDALDDTTSAPISEPQLSPEQLEVE